MLTPQQNKQKIDTLMDKKEEHTADTGHAMYQLLAGRTLECCECGSRWVFSFFLGRWVQTGEED